MKLKFSFFTLVLILSSNLFAQKPVLDLDFDDISKKGLEFSKDGAYHSAYLEYCKIDKNDSNYVHSLVSKAYYLINDEELDSTRYDKVLKILKEGFDHPNVDSKYYLFINRGATLIQQKKFKEAIKNYEQALAKYPKSNTFYMNKGQAHEGLDQYIKAVEMYKKSISINPFNADAHLKLGNLCYRSNKITEALICFNFYLILNPDGENSLNVLGSVNTIVSSKVELKDPIDVEISKDDESFEDIDLIINNHVALNKKYKIKNKIKASLVKQNHLFLDQLKNYEGNDGFFHKKYIPFFNWINKNKHFDNFIYTICFSSTSDQYTNIIKSKTNDVKEFYALAVNKIGECFGENEIYFNGKNQTVTYYYENKKLLGIGKKEGNNMTGFWEVYSDNGYIQSSGDFEEGKKTGKWNWFYENGIMKEEVHFKANKLDGIYKYYYSDGQLKYTANYSDDKLNGEYKLYNTDGALIEQKIFVDNELDGMFKSFYEIGGNYPEYLIPYKAGKIDGQLIQFHVNGVKARETAYVEGFKNGMESEFYINGQSIYALKYIEGMATGEYKKYYSNGILKEEGQLKDNEYVGEWKSYHPNGKPDYVGSYAKNKLHGVYKQYDIDGKHFLTLEYKKGDIYSYSFFDKSGKLIHSDDKKSGNLNYKGYHPNGNINSEGIYNLKGGKEGNWKFYSTNGQITSSSSYKENMAHGQSVFYFNNGGEETVREYEDDLAIGYFTKKDRLGKIVEQGHLKNGKTHGIWETYYPTNILQQKNYYNNAKLEGEQIGYDVEGGIASIDNYKDGKLTLEKYYIKGTIYDSIVTPYKDKDTAYTHYTNGKVNAQVIYNFGKKNGKYLNYYADGTVNIEGHYLNSKKNGEWIWYHPNGKIRSKFNYIYGESDGEGIRYHENGQIKETSSYLLGDQIGEEKDYNNKGILTSITNYKSGKLNGKRYFYSEDGHLQLIRFYHNNELIGYSYLDKNGKELAMIPIKKETVKIVSYFDNGKKAREMELINGDFENEYIKYYYSGQLHEKQTFLNDEEVGITNTYYASGKIKMVGNYIHNVAHGKVTEYYENGQIKKESNYNLGRYHGESISYSENGKITKRENYFDDNLIFD